MSSPLSAFGLAEGYDPASFGGGVHVGNGVLFDVGDALRLGNGVIRTSDQGVIQALSAYPALVPLDSMTSAEAAGDSVAEETDGDQTDGDHSDEETVTDEETSGDEADRPNAQAATISGLGAARGA